MDIFWSTSTRPRSVETRASEGVGGDLPLQRGRGVVASPALTEDTAMTGATALLHPRQPTDEEIEGYDIWTYVVEDFGNAWGQPGATTRSLRRSALA